MWAVSTSFVIFVHISHVLCKIWDNYFHCLLSECIISSSLEKGHCYLSTDVVYN